MKKNRERKYVYYTCAAAVLGFFALFTARLADWQLVRGGEYRELADSSTNYTISSEPIRGEILDRNGNGLVTNKTLRRIVIIKPLTDEKKLDGVLLELVGLLRKTGDSFTDLLPLEDRNGVCAFKTDAGDERELLLSDSFTGLGKTASAEDCFDALRRRYGLEESYTRDQLLTLVSIRYSMERQGYSGETPFVLAEDIGGAAAAAVSESFRGLGGVEVQTYPLRTVDKPSLAPHIIGALGALSAEEYEELSDKGYGLNDRIGKFGIEHAFENELRGKSGRLVISRGADGGAPETVETVEAEPGKTVWLTLDSRLQKTAADSLEKNIRAANAEGRLAAKSGNVKNVGEDCETGAAVMLRVSDFAVLAAASYPGYDLERYTSDGDYFSRLMRDERSPMYDRAFSGSFACGSVFKPCVAMAALEEKVIRSDSEIFCGGSYDYYPSNAVRCMHRHGALTFHGALVQSCNCFFAEAGRRLGIGSISEYAEGFGLGEATGLELEESRGTLAGRDSASWQAGNTVQAAIGQSDNAFTPVQLAAYAATIANNGTRLRTHIVQKITDYERKTISADHSKPEKLSDAGVSAKNLRAVQKAMLDVTRSADGTAHSFFGDYGIKVAAKTGTAENAGSDHATFICYAPFEKPEVAVAVVIEHGVWGRFPMGVARDLLDSYFSEKNRGQNQ